jgi:hypothetical protein
MGPPGEEAHSMQFGFVFLNAAALPPLTFCFERSFVIFIAHVPR